MTDVEVAKLFVEQVMPEWTLRKENDNTYTLFDIGFNEIIFFEENGERAKLY